MTRLLTTLEVAAILGKHRKTINAMVRRGELIPAAIKAPRGYLFDPLTMRPNVRAGPHDRGE